MIQFDILLYAVLDSVKLHPHPDTPHVPVSTVSKQHNTTGRGSYLLFANIYAH